MGTEVEMVEGCRGLGGEIGGGSAWEGRQRFERRVVAWVGGLFVSRSRRVAGLAWRRWSRVRNGCFEGEFGNNGWVDVVSGYPK